MEPKQGWRAVLDRESTRTTIAALLGTVVFLYSFGFRLLDPSNVGWLLTREDPSTYLIGWEFFRSEGWGWPLGGFSGYLAPAGTSIGHTDSIPLMALLLKPLSFLLPEPFQYFGIWILLSYALMAYFAYRILRRHVSSQWVLWLGVLLLLLNPLQLRRQAGHIALGSHWLILAALWLYLRAALSDDYWRTTVRRWAILGAVCALVHPYLTAMVLGIGVAALARQASGGVWRRALEWAGGVAVFGVVVLSMWLAIGTLEFGGSGESSASTGFGTLSMNLNAPINGDVTSRFLKPMGYATGGQYEGFAYFGLGILLCGLVAGILILRNRPAPDFWRGHRALRAVLALCFLFALSNVVTFGGNVLLEYRIPGFLDPVTGTFRSSGRFFWPIYYLFIALTIIVLATRLRPRSVIALLLLSVGLQVVDLADYVGQQRTLAGREFTSRLQSPHWAGSAEHFDLIATVPPYGFSTRNQADFADLAWRAHLNGQAVGTGYAARFSPADTGQRMAEFREMFSADAPDPRTLYVFRDAEFVRYAPMTGGKFRYAVLDGYPIGFAASVSFAVDKALEVEIQGLPEFLAAHRDQIVVVAVRDEATDHMSAEQKAALTGLGLYPAQLAYRGSWVGIAYQGAALWEQHSTVGAVEARFAAGNQLGPLRLQRGLAVRSAGFTVGNSASILVDGVQYAPQSRGLNLCVLDADLNVLRVASFDTHVGGAGVVYPVGWVPQRN